MATKPANTTEERDFVTIAEFAAHFRIHKMSVGRNIHNGNIRAIRVGSRWRIPVAEFERCKTDGF